MLDCSHPPGRERPPVADGLDHVHQRHRWVAWPDEVCVQRVHWPVRRNGAARGDKSLTCHLAAEDTLPALTLRTFAAEDVHLDLLQIKQVNDLIECLAHCAASLPGTAGEASPSARLPCDFISWPASSAHSSITAAPYRSSLTAPTPGMPASSRRLAG